VRPRPLVATMILVALVPSMARGQAPPNSADELYRTAQALLQSGQLAEACVAFRGSAKIDPALGAILSVAYCDEQEGRPATAWGRYAMVARRAHERGQTEREQFARGRATALEVKVTHVHLSVAPPSARVTIDGESAEFADDKTILVPPGDHAIEVVIAGQAPWTTKVQLGEARETPDPSFVVPEGVVPVGVAPETAPPPLEPARGSTQRIVGLSVAGVGVVGLVVGAIFGVKTLGISGTCPIKTACPQTDIDQANTNGIVSDFGFGIGVAGLGAGAWIFFSAPRARSTTAWQLSPQVGPGASGLALGRAW